MNKILVFGMTENPGGVESFLMNYYRKIDKTKFQFDFLCNSYEKIAYEDEIIESGGHTFHFIARSKNYTRYKRELENFFKKYAREYNTIWVNVCSLANIDYLKMAKKYGIKKRIIHSHNSQNMDSKLRGMLHKINKQMLERWATDYWACSEDAAKWFFKDSLLKKSIVIHNAIDVDRMQFDELKREKIRLDNGWDDNTLVIGNIGRLHFQKNQKFAIDVFKKLYDLNSDYRLVLIGQGEDEAEIKCKIHQYNLDNVVIMAGIQNDIQGWLSAFDLFLFPSVFEGLSIVALEAQANGIPVLASEKVIPVDVRINKNFEFFSLHKSVEEWAGKISDMIRNGCRLEHSIVKNSFINVGFDIETEVEKLEGMLKTD